MTEPHTINPALTPWEWNEVTRDDKEWWTDRICEAAARFAGTTTTASPRHALAALALHGQPFGFTRKDVRRLREHAVADSRTQGPHEAHWAWHLAARIEALLPPLDAPPQQP